MRFELVFLVLVLVFLMGCSEGVAVNEPIVAAEEEEKKVIVAYGDSLTYGLGVDREDTYPSQLEQLLIENGYDDYRVVNSGVSGETSQGALSRVDWVLTLEPDLVILTIGANDGFRGVPPLIIKENIGGIIRQLQAEDVEVVLGGMIMLTNLGENYTTSFAQIYPDLAEQYDVELIPFFLEGVAGDSSLNQEDEIHPTKEGYTVVVEQNVWPVLEQVLE